MLIHLKPMDGTDNTHNEQAVWIRGPLVLYHS
jgi:hypothetical protein